MTARADIGPRFATIDGAIISRFRKAGVATVVEALGVPRGFQQTMTESMVRRTTGRCIAGQAVTAANGLADNLMMHVALEVAERGQVLVLAGSGPFGAVWGEMVSVGAATKGLAGAVIDGSTRDVDAIERLGFAVWSTAVRPFGAAKRASGSVNLPVTCAGVRVSPGDLVVADGDGVVAVPQELVAETLEATERRLQREVLIREAAAGGLMPGTFAGHIADVVSG
ncbi:MAG: RraA family protein [bacterium]|nr:RraA family protein [bacterium]MDE0440274.1 RraA family protein [bacterium]